MKKMIPLDLNESYWLLDDETYRKCCAIPKKYFGTYPDYKLLIADIARYVGVRPDMVTVAPGSDDAIEAIMEWCQERAPRALLPMPTFSGYERVLTKVPLQVSTTYYRESAGRFLFPLDDVMNTLHARNVDAIFLCSPNNPLGTSLERHEMDAILTAARESKTLVVVDEAYAEFSGESVIDRVMGQKLIVLRTLSKAFGAPGIRVGYSISSPDIARELAELILGVLPWPIPGPSVHMARTVLARADALKVRRDLVSKQRAIFFDGLSKIDGIAVYPSVGNFVLIRLAHATDVANAMLAKGIRAGVGEMKTWDHRSKEILTSTLRLTVPSPEDTPRVLLGLQDAISGQKASSMVEWTA